MALSAPNRDFAAWLAAASAGVGVAGVDRAESVSNAGGAILRVFCDDVDKDDHVRLGLLHGSTTEWMTEISFREPGGAAG